MSEDYWDGATWIYRAQITNGAGGSGTIEFQIVPGVGNEFELLYATLTNGDTSSRTPLVAILEPSGQVLTDLWGTSISAGSRVGFPVTDEVSDSAVLNAGAHIIVSGDCQLLFRLSSVAASQDFIMGIAGRIRGGLPTVTEVGNSTPTITISTERVV